MPRKKKTKVNTHHNLVYAILWGIVATMLGILLVFFGFKPMFQGADLMDSFNNIDITKSLEANINAAAGLALDAAITAAPNQKTIFGKEEGNTTELGLTKTQDELIGTGISMEKSIIRVILGWVNFSLPFAGLFAFVGIVYAGFLYVVNFANEEMANKAKNIIFLCVLGLVVIFSAYAIVSTILRASTA